MTSYRAGAGQQFETIRRDIDGGDGTLVLRLQIHVLEVEWPEAKVAVVRAGGTEHLVQRHAVNRNTSCACIVTSVKKQVIRLTNHTTMIRFVEQALYGCCCAESDVIH